MIDGEWRDNPGRVMVTLSWDEVDGRQHIDCDILAILCGENGKLASREDIVGIENCIHASNAVRYIKDSPAGRGEEDAEQLLIQLEDLPARYEKIVLVTSIYQANLRRQYFGLIHNLSFRVIDCSTQEKLIDYDVPGDFPGMGAFIVGEIYRGSGSWGFRLIGQALKDGELSRLVKRYK
jgi:stress response protein SCP2